MLSLLSAVHCISPDLMRIANPVTIKNPMHPGGIADKTGNRYEAAWLIRHLVELIDGRARSIAIEMLGEEGAGFEFRVERHGHYEWHQCKRQTSGSWTIGRLASEGVLAHFATKIAASTSDTCIFVSTDPAKPLKRLKEKQPAAQNAEQFEQSLSEDEQTQWQSLQRALDLDPEAGLDWLARCEFQTFPERELDLTLTAELDRWFASPPENVRGALREWIEGDGNFNRPLYTSDLESFLRARGIAIKQYEFDGTIPGKLQLANSDYDGSYRPVGAGLFDIERSEVAAVLAALDDAGGPRTIALAGPAGSGKSVVIRKALAQMADGARPLLAFRVDKVPVVATLSELGEATMEIGDSPAVVLEQLAKDRPAILIVDQADAVSEMSGRTTAVRAVLLKLLRQARHYPGLKVVFSCRSFDLENDHEFREFTDERHCVRIDVAPLRWAEDVAPVLARLRIGVKDAGAKIQALLCQPIGLAIAAELSRDGPIELGHVEHISQLYQELLSRRDRELRDQHGANWSVFEALGSVARAMSEREQLAAHVSVLDRYPGAVDLLQQAGLAVVQGQRLMLMHESLFDYLHARAFIADGGNLQAFLLGSEQTLFRRTQVRQILSQERDLDRPAYLADLRFVLCDARVREHVRDLVLRWLATIPDPSPEEWQLVLAHGASGDPLPRHTGRVIYGHHGWVAQLERIGVLDQWFAVNSDEDLFWALRAVEQASSAWESGVVRILDSFLEQRPEKASLLLRCFEWFQPDRPMPELAALLIRCLDLCDSDLLSSVGETPFNLADGWSKHAPEQAGAILSAVLAHWYRHHARGTPFGDDTHHLHRDFHHFAELAEAHPEIALRSILPAMRVAMERTERAEGGAIGPVEDGIWHWRRRDRGDGPHAYELIDMVTEALQRVAKAHPERAADILASLDPRRHMTALHLLLETVAANPSLAHLLAAEVDNPGLFKAGWSHARAYSAGKAMAASWDLLAPDVRTRLEERLLGLYPEHGFAVRTFARSKLPADPKNWSPEQLTEWARHSLADAGKTQWSTLRQLAGVALSPAARRRLVELDRKFAGREPEEPDGIRSGSTLSPISPDSARKMNNAAWLSAMRADWSEKRRWRDGTFYGGSEELSRVLQEEAKADPDRFIGLFWTLPADVPEVFRRAILRGVGESALDTGALDDLLARMANGPHWQADDATVLGLVTQRRGEALGAFATTILRWIAATGEPGREEERTRKTGEKPEALFRTAINRGHELGWRGRQAPRGEALDILGRLAWHSPDLFHRHRDLVDLALAEGTPDTVLAASLTFVLSAIKHDTAQAVQWLDKLIALSPLCLASEHGQRALLRLDNLRHDDAKPLLLRLLNESDPAMSALAAAMIMVGSYEGLGWEEERAAIVAGDGEWRAAAAHVAVNQIDGDVADDELDATIAAFFDDPEPLVRSEAADVFRHLNSAGIAAHASLYRRYLQSPHFDGERTYLIHRLEDAPPELDELVLELVELAASKAGNAKSGRGDVGYQLWPPLMRIYTSNPGNASVRGRCLDVVDRLIAADALGSDRLNEVTR